MSYASGDRVAARLLRDTLEAQGLDVWLDEEELAGGEAWDAKIRQQIRTCTYFMPVISATTEARREGYFRREWRLAVERTLDLADDVMFLVPVVIDETREQGARVPEKFTSVHWLKCPGGQATPALIAVARRLVLGEAATETPAERADAPAPSRAQIRAERAKEKVTFQAFPAFPSQGNRSRFVYELVVWTGHTIRALWLHLPRWLRYMATIIIVFNLATNLFQRGDSSERAARREKIAREASFPAQPPDAPALKERLLSVAGVALDELQGGRPLAVVTFTSLDASVTDSAMKAFGAFTSKLNSEGREQQVAVSISPFPKDASDTVILARATTLRCRWILTGVARSTANNNLALDVKLYDATSGKIIWQDTREGKQTDADEVGTALGIEALNHVPFETPKVDTKDVPPLATPAAPKS